jgi:ribonucleoside-triphosphate reductase
MVYKQYWCEHNPSITVYVKPEEWISVGAWVFNNFREVSGIAFLPHTDNVYVQAPYQKVTEEEEYQEMQDGMPKDIDWSELMEYEEEDNTTGSQTLSCTGDTCEIVDIT